jgi:2-C-methyl-D-erythritol 4-phosphate cytidylyltransferase
MMFRTDKMSCNLLLLLLHLPVVWILLLPKLIVVSSFHCTSTPTSPTLRLSSSSSSSSSSLTPLQSSYTSVRITNAKKNQLCSSPAAAATTGTSIVMEEEEADDWSDVGIVLLAGGTGSRMKASMPKQFLPLAGKPILHHSIDLFLEQIPFQHVVLVIDPIYQPEYQPMVHKYNGRLSLANPGVERQGSVENGLYKLMEVASSESSSSSATTIGGAVTSKTCTYVAIHDSARPLVTIAEVRNVIRDARKTGAAVLSVPCKATIKESMDGGQFVFRTIPRERLYEVHTPQVVRVDLLLRGFQQVTLNHWQVTDDVSIVEQLKEPVRLTRGEYTNLKITTPEDMEVAEAILRERRIGKQRTRGFRKAALGVLRQVTQSFIRN